MKLLGLMSIARLNRRKSNDGDGETASPASRPLAPLVESPTSAYLVGVGIGIGCGALALLLLLGATLSL